MGEATLVKVVEEVKALPVEDQRRLRDMLDAWLTPKTPMTEDEFDQYLYKIGLLGRMPLPITDLEPYQNRDMLEVEGKPLSEIIIEERR